MDRNLPFWSLSRCRIRSLSARRAWIEISMSYNAAKFWGSLSARRAWIEITVAAHVGRRKLSLSARRAWIEMSNHQAVDFSLAVALRKESVDRNTQRRDFKALGLRRSPQGERG